MARKIFNNYKEYVNDNSYHAVCSFCGTTGYLLKSTDICPKCGSIQTLKEVPKRDNEGGLYFGKD